MNKEESSQIVNSEENSEADNENNEKCQHEEEIQKLKDTVLRTLAESENLRKRLEKEKEEAIKYSKVSFAKDLLPVIDNFERVTENASLVKGKIENDEKLKALFEGVLLCEKELISVFKKHGVSKIETKESDKFDPEYHLAMNEIENPNLDPGSIVNVFQTGYMYNERLLRPAMVSVTKKTATTDKN
ncbi:MAG: nucleotide exchange factor GrpE [Holosporaceae bacterium]|jgi:molecular chaperone GrpE|nr:nucleotide exchange factor GrpE [Holosporaceae bacterium]